MGWLEVDPIILYRRPGFALPTFNPTRRDMNPYTRHYTTAATATFSFRDWYALMGYHRHGGQKACAEAIGTTPRMVRYLMEGKREPSNTLVKLCQLMECKKYGKEFFRCTNQTNK